MKTNLLKREFDIIERLMVHLHPGSLMAAAFWLEIAKYKLIMEIRKHFRVMKRYLDADQIKVLEKNGIKTKNNPDFAYMDILMEHPCIGIYELLALLPKKIEDSECDDDDYEDKYLLKIYPISNRVSYELICDPLCGEYDPFELEIFKSDELVDSLFDALVWVTTNKYIHL